MKKLFTILAVVLCTMFAAAQTNQYYWYNGNMMMGNAIAQIDSVTFGSAETVDTLFVLLPRTIIKEVHDTTIVTIHDTTYINNYIYLTEGSLMGEFSVSASTKVRFSKGNLQYHASTNTWRFAENQYDTIGINNQYISSTNSGWIDLFGWGTGNNPTNTSKKNNNYSSFVDWGINPISNGGNTSNLWRTLTKDEWAYLAHERENAENLFAMGSVNGINGLILLPDNWIMPNGISDFVIGTENGLIWRPDNSDYFNPNGDSFSHNLLTAVQWQILEASGAIFLPAAGARRGSTTVWNVNQRGSYWSTMAYDSEWAYDFDFYSDCFNPQESYDNTKYFGQSVRLVKDVE